MINPVQIVKRMQFGEFEVWVVKKTLPAQKDTNPVIHQGNKMHTIVEIIAKEAGIDSAELFKPNKGKQPISDCRMICMYAIKYFLPETTYEQVGQFFNRDHTTALYAIKTVTNRIAVNDPYVMEIIEKVIKSNIHAKI